MTTATQNQIVLTGKEIKELKKVIKGIPHYKKMPILNNVKVTLAENEITVTSIAPNFTVTKKIPAEVNGHGSFLLPIAEIKNLKGFKNSDSFKLEFENFTAKLDGMTFHIMDAEEFPKDNLDEYEYITTINYDEILNIEKAIISTSKSETRPVLTGVLFRNNEIISTDSHRLFKTTSQIEHDKDILVPAEAVKNLKEHFNKDSQIKVSVNDYNLKFEDEFTTFETRLIVGNFPDVSRIIPDDLYAKTTVTISNLKEFTNILTAATNITKNTQNNVVKFEIENKQLIISASHEGKSFEKEFQLSGFTGEPLKISMSGKYLLDGLKQLEGNEITFHFNGHLRPFTATGSGKGLVLILPVRTY